jgi:hypothetical protein
MNLQFSEDVLEMCLHGFRADVKTVTDFIVVKPLRDQLKNFKLAA